MSVSEEKYQKIKKNCPEGCLVNQEGHYVPKEVIEARVLLQDELVGNLFAEILELAQLQKTVKNKHVAEYLDFVDLATDSFVDPVKALGLKLPPLFSFDGRRSVEIDVQPVFRANVRIAELQELVRQAGQEVEGGKKIIAGIMKLAVGKKANTKLIKQMNGTGMFDGSESWSRAMALLPDCLDLVDKSIYIRYRTYVDGRGTMLELNWSSIPVDI
ncbi:MAG: DUF3164 family protein, partial [Candidatus Electrothrix sp. ATG2]|nr:DUF3164 family protein [Candidatus Electrothrix sp. ATG2]